MTRIRRGRFDEGGKAARDLIRFKSALHNKLNHSPFVVSDFAKCIVNYTNNKFNRQLAKIEKYIDQVSQGQTVFFKDIFLRGSDVDASSPE